MMEENIKRLAEISGNARRHVVGADAAAPTTALVPTPSVKQTFLERMREIGSTAAPPMPAGSGTIIGAIAGGLLWGERRDARGEVVWNSHRVLGALGGASVGRNLPALLDGSTRKAALGQLTATGTGIAGALLVGEAGLAARAVGFVVGSLVGAGVAHFAGLK